MSAATKQQVAPVELANVSLEQVERLSFALYKLTARYRDTPNYPDCQPLKASIWTEWEATKAELTEALNG